ncbi:MAG: hypothetical protein IJ035_08410 [Oscillospiraceae bacterium]|nr:hypothetical protein [Oscillospiraceae bacterium]
MKCFYHPERDAVAQCNECKRGLCRECAQKWNPPHCDGCGVSIKQVASAQMKIIKTFFIVGIILGILYGIGAFAITVGESIGAGLIGLLSAVLMGPLMGYSLAGWTVGWNKLSNFTSKFFLFLPIVGWLIYFGIKLTLAYFVGFFALPFEYKRLKNIINN